MALNPGQLAAGVYYHVYLLRRRSNGNRHHKGVGVLEVELPMRFGFGGEGKGGFLGGDRMGGQREGEGEGV